MDEDDSQDELINRSTSHSKGKRAATWAISDDSDDSEESEDGESDSGEEEGEDHLNGHDEEEEEEEGEEEGNEDEDDEEELEDGAVGGTSADFEVLSSDEDSDKCPICLNSFTSQPVATPESCEHYFCFDCILEWAKNANSCPVDRLAFNSIYLRKSYGGKVKKMITVQKPVKEGQEETVDLNLEQTNCEVCGGSDREDRLLLCDGCDAGYHMECLTPPINSVPVEEWFCPECQANNRHSRDLAEVSDSEGRPSTARPATSRSQSRAAGPTRAIARTQQSERVRANVNRHRITQARTSQLAPTYLIQSTWLDETINAVVAGLNTAVYVRDFTPRVPSGRRRKYAKRRKVKTKKTSSSQDKKSKAMNTTVKRRKRRERRTKMRRKKVIKKTTTSRSRIASSLGIVKDKKGSSLPTVYRPSEHTLSNMRADIGAASLSIYGDPFDLDPFTDREDDEEQTHVTSLLEAKRRGISRSALRSHQPVARPITARLSRRDVVVPQSGDVVEAAPVPDLLGSILSGQSMLLMDSSDVVINRDGSLKATKPVAPSPLLPASRGSSSGDASTLISPVSSPSLGESALSPHHSAALPGPSSSTMNRDLTPSSSRSPPFVASPPSHTQTAPHSDAPRRRHPSLLPPHSARPTTSPARWGTGGVGASREIASSAVHPTPDFSTKSKGVTQSQSQSKKAPAKPMWLDVSVLPRIPKIKRDGSSATPESTSQRGINDRSGRGNGSSSSTVSNGYGMHETGIHSLSGDKGRQQSVDQQKSQVERQAQRHRPDGASSSSSSFSNSFSSASSSAGAAANQSRCPSTPSSSSAVSFRINSSGNSWHSRRLSIASSSASGDTRPGHCREKEDKAKKRQLRRDKQMLLASHMEQENDMYDPFNPTLSDSSSSGSDVESTSLTACPSASYERKPPNFVNVKATVKEENSIQFSTQTRQLEVSQEGSGTARTTVPEIVTCSEDIVKVKKESTIVNIKKEKPTVVLDIKIKKEPESDDETDSERCDESVNSCLNSETIDSTPPAHHSLDPVKTERGIKEEHSGQSSATRSKDETLASSSSTSKKNLKEQIKSESTPSSKSLLRDSHQNQRPSKPLKEQCSSSSETDRSRRVDHHSLGRGSRQKERDKDKEKSTRRAPSGERRRARSSSSDSSQPGSSDRAQRKRGRSRSKDNPRRRRSRSASGSSSRERERRKTHKQHSKGRDEGRERGHERRRLSKDKRRSRSRSKSQSKSRSRSRSRSRSKDRKRSRSKSRSRSRERRKDHARQQHSSHSSRDKVESRSKDKRRPRSRSNSRERRKKEGSSKSLQKTSGSSSEDTKQSHDKKKVKDITQSSIKEKKVPEVRKQELPSCASKVIKEEKDVTESQRADLVKEIKPVKEIKKEKLQCFDMFEDSPSDKPIKKEEADMPPLTVNTDEETHTPHKTEPCELKLIKCEPEICQLPPVTPPSTLIAPVKTECEQTLPEPAELSFSATTQHTAGSAVSAKREAQQPSDSEEDFNVDVMLDNLDYVKSEPPEGSGTALKQEKEGKEGPPVSTLAGTKAKTQVKRVTWNIQEPEGPQPEKSASKLALYKLKLKQEGSRRPFLAAQASGQDISGIVGDPSKKGAAVLPSTSSHSDGLHPEALSTSGQAEGDEGDQSRKDKYLKKLHMLERAIEEVKLAIKPFYQRRDINKGEYKEILRKAVQKVCHSKSGEINPVKVGNLVKAYVDKYKHARKHRKEDDSGKAAEVQAEAMQISDSP